MVLRLAAHLFVQLIVKYLKLYCIFAVHLFYHKKLKKKNTMGRTLQALLFSLTLTLALSTSAFGLNGGEVPLIPIAVQYSDDIQVYPNPAVDYIMISENEAVKEVWIYNILGNRVRTYNAEADKRYDVRDLPRGMYVIRLVDGNSNLVTTRRINKINP